jgi:hypothetical protein
MHFPCFWRKAFQCGWFSRIKKAGGDSEKAGTLGTLGTLARHQKNCLHPGLVTPPTPFRRGAIYECDLPV